MKILSFLFLLFTVYNVNSQTAPEIFPYPKMYLFDNTQASSMTINAVISSPNSDFSKFSKRIQTIVKETRNEDIQIQPFQDYFPNYGIYIGLASDSFYMKSIKNFNPRYIEPVKKDGYSIDINEFAIVIIGQSEEGIASAIKSLQQILLAPPPSLNTFVWDYSDFPERWVFSQHNLRGQGAVKTIKAISDSLDKFKINGFSNHDFKLNRLKSEIPIYFRNLDTIVRYWNDRSIKPIPGVANFGWSEGLLSNNPHLAEGVLTRVKCIVEGDSLRILPVQNVWLTNSGFELVTGNGDFAGWSFYDGAGLSTFRDLQEKHSGTSSARCTNFTAGNTSGNCRFNKLLQCEPYRQYTMTAWFKTDNFKADEVRLLALAGTRALTYTSFSIPSTSQGWQKIEVAFNTLENTQMNIYLGVWGGKQGTIWFDDFEIKEAGFMNILRRNGTPVTLRNLTKATIPVEGKDLDSIIDPTVSTSLGNYGPLHTVRSPRLKGGSSISNGDSIFVEYFHPFTAVSDNNYSGSTMACVSEPEVDLFIEDQFQRVDSLFQKPDWFFFQHDEIRNMNRDSSCLHTKKSPSMLLSDNINRCSSARLAVNSKGRSIVWSDMIDSLHNARNNYYLINGDLRGVWSLIDPKPVVMNWNNTLKKESSENFENLGFKQMASSYYDVGNTSTLRDWRIMMEGNESFEGAMYTTWNSDYRFLKAFGYYYWGAGPNFHNPTVELCSKNDSLNATIEILSDPFDSKDSIVSVSIVLSTTDVSAEFPLSKKNKGVYEIKNQAYKTDSRWTNKEIDYYFLATNVQGITNKSCIFNTCPIVTSVHQFSTESPKIISFPNSIKVTSQEKGEVKIVDILGKLVVSFTHPGFGEQIYSTASLQFGTYLSVFSTSKGITTVLPFIHR